MLLQPHLLQHSPLGDCRRTIAAGEHSTNGDDNHIAEQMPTIDFRPRVWKLVEELDDVGRILVTDREHGNPFVLVC